MRCRRASLGSYRATTLARYAAGLTTAPTYILLPGLDGTGEMFGPLLAELPVSVARKVIAYPTGGVTTQAELADSVATQLEAVGPVVLIAESYSGPIALRLATRLGERVVGVVLVAAFVENPTVFPSWLAAALPDWPFRAPPPDLVLRALLLGGSAPDSLVHQLSAAIALASPKVLAERIRQVLRLRAEDTARLDLVPVLYLRATQDRMVAGRATVAVAQRCALLTVQDVPGPHLLAQHAPAAVWSAIQGWLATLRPDVAAAPASDA